MLTQWEILICSRRASMNNKNNVQKTGSEIKVTPIFIFSLPRSGSTLLQRILMRHSKIASVSEPWILLPFIYPFRKEGVLAEYSHRSCCFAVADFIDNLPEKEKDYYNELCNFVLSIYSRYCKNGEIYFLDKTPRYFLIIPELAKIFPNAKFIFLFRNPVQIVASMLVSKGDRFSKLGTNYNDLIAGPKFLTEGRRLLRDKSIVVNYEKLVDNSDEETGKVFDYLGLDYNDSLSINIGEKKLKGRMGDKKGAEDYRDISLEPLDKWKRVLNTSFRKKWIRNYIDSFDEDIYHAQGYNKKEILSEINKLPTGYRMILKDFVEWCLFRFLIISKPEFFFRKNSWDWAVKKFLS